MFSWMEVRGQWKDGIAYPRWAALAHWGFGEPRFLFYPPASWTLGAALGAVLPWKMVPGAYCWIALMFAGAAMYRLAREWLPARDALFAAAFYALNPYHAGRAAVAASAAVSFEAPVRLSSNAMVESHVGRRLADERTRSHHDSLLGSRPRAPSSRE